MSDGIYYSILIIAGIFIVGFSSATMERSYMRRQAVEHNAAVYDPYTADFTWK